MGQLLRKGGLIEGEFTMKVLFSAFIVFKSSCALTVFYRRYSMEPWIRLRYKVLRANLWHNKLQKWQIKSRAISQAVVKIEEPLKAHFGQESDYRPSI